MASRRSIRCTLPASTFCPAQSSSATGPTATPWSPTVPASVLGILTADCAPILLADPEAGVIGAAHAGWKGAVDGIVYATVLAMVALGADPASIRRSDRPDHLRRQLRGRPRVRRRARSRQHPTPRATSASPEGGREHFDLPGFRRRPAARRRRRPGRRPATLHLRRSQRYFSHRCATHEGTTTGRQIALIGLR